MISRLLDFIYPSLCELCSAPLARGHSLCSPCFHSLPRVSRPFCEQCGEPFDGNLADPFDCPNCRNLTFAFDFALASLRGLDLAFTLVHNLKYRRRFYLARDLARFLQETLQSDPRFEQLGPQPILVPVPLHWKRQQWRHGNQADELARAFSQLTGLPTLNALRRIRKTKTQTRLNRKQRLSNLRGAFLTPPKYLPLLAEKSIILIDDVFTTGSTAHECSRILHAEAKVKKIAVLTLLRG